MKDTVRQQIVISGVGGQGVLLVTRLLAEAAMENAFSVLTSETHGMAQRGGTVVSHLKVGSFSSPMIRQGQADGLIALKDETVAPYLPLLRPDGWVAVNRVGGAEPSGARIFRPIDAGRIALAGGYPRSVNLVMLGCALAMMEKYTAGSRFCSLTDIQGVVKARMNARPGVMDQALSALSAGYAFVV